VDGGDIQEVIIGRRGGEPVASRKPSRWRRAGRFTSRTDCTVEHDPSTVRRTTIRESDLAIELERKTMGLMEFVGLPADGELRQFWFAMARHEAAHCGALMLVESFFESDPDLAARRTSLRHVDRGPATVASAIVAKLAADRSRRALEMALDLEGSELEDVVVELLQVVKDPGWRDQAVKMMIHDLGELSYMIEHTRDAKLLKGADALMERRRSRYGFGADPHPAGLHPIIAGTGRDRVRPAAQPRIAIASPSTAACIGSTKILVRAGETSDRGARELARLGWPFSID
jgi:hypothetical protein